jgi:Domain of unknown function (DUF6438)
LNITTTNSEIIIQHDSLNKGPIYSLRIDRNGNIEYNGISNVKTLGKVVDKISPRDLRHIIRLFNNFYFFSFNDSYELNSNQSGLKQEQQQTSISFRLGDNYKNVKYLEGAYRLPSTLKFLVETIEKITDLEKLTGKNNSIDSSK